MNKDKERARLAAIHFKDAPDDVTRVAMNKNGTWCICFLVFKQDFGFDWGLIMTQYETPRQPTTTLDWRDTLLRRADYEVR